MIKITIGNKHTVLASRAEQGLFGAIIKSISSTEPQPFVAANFIDGKICGGRTITQAYYDSLLATATKEGWKVDQIDKIEETS